MKTVLRCLGMLLFLAGIFSFGFEGEVRSYIGSALMIVGTIFALKNGTERLLQKT